MSQQGLQGDTRRFDFGAETSVGSKERKGAPEFVYRLLFRMTVSFGSFRVVVKRSAHQCNDQLPLPPAADTAAQGAGAKLEAGGCSSWTWIRCPMTRAG